MSAQVTPAGGNRADVDRLLGIEVLRFVCSFVVLLFHYQHFDFYGLARADASIALQPFHVPLYMLYRYGFCGVQVFWCISGFIFFWKYGQPIAAGTVPPFRFFVLRFSRLYPLHLATLLAVAAMQFPYMGTVGTPYVYPFNDLYHFVLHLFMASGWGLETGESFNGPAWSVSSEVLVYAFFFLQMRYTTSSLWALLAVFAASLIVVFLHVASSAVLYCLMFFYLGCITAIVYAWLARAGWLRHVALCLAAVVALAWGFVCWQRQWTTIMFLLVDTPLVILLSMAIVPRSKRVADAITLAGNLTYSSYLLHVPLQLLVALVALGCAITLPFGSPFFLGAYIVVVLALSHVCYVKFELPMQAWLRRRLLPARG